MSGDNRVEETMPEKFTDISTIEPVPTLDCLIERLNEVFAEDRVNVEYVKALMETYKSNPREWKKYAKFDTHRYTRNLVNEGNGKFNLMILCWGERHASSIHSHAGSHCFLKVLDGQMSESLYEWPETVEDKENANAESKDSKNDAEYTPMELRETLTFKQNSVTYMNDSLGLHRMENPSNSNGAVTLHCYSPPFQECFCFDERSARKIVSKMTFWSKYGERTPLIDLPRRTSVDLLNEKFGTMMKVARSNSQHEVVYEEPENN